MGVRDIANALAKKYKSRNPFEIVAGMNAFIVFAPLNDIRGFYQYFQRNNIIYIDENLSYNERMFVCAHELAHMLLHKKSNTIYMDTRTNFNTSKLENPFYIGKVRWNRQKHDDHTIKDKSEWIIADGEHEGIFSDEYFNHIQDLILKKSRPYKSRSTAYTKHWLSGMVKCSDCGKSLVAKRSNNIVTHFNCTNYFKGTCKVSHYVTVSKLEAAIYDAFDEVMKNSDNMSFVIRERDNNEHPKDNISIIKEQLSKLEWKEKRIKTAYIDGIDSLEEYKENKKMIDEERTSLELELKKEPLASDNKVELKREIRSVYDIIRDTDIDQRKRADALRSVVDHIVYDKANDEIQVFFYLLKPL